MAIFDDPLDAARKRLITTGMGKSYFPAVNQRLFGERNDLLRDVDAAFYGGGNAPPTPTPTPTPAPRSYFGFNPFQLPARSSNPYSITPTPSPTPSPTPNLGFGMNRNNPWEDWQQKYGFGF